MSRQSFDRINPIDRKKDAPGTPQPQGLGPDNGRLLRSMEESRRLRVNSGISSDKEKVAGIRAYLDNCPALPPIATVSEEEMRSREFYIQEEATDPNPSRLSPLWETLSISSGRSTSSEGRDELSDATRISSKGKGKDRAASFSSDQERLPPAKRPRMDPALDTGPSRPQGTVSIRGEGQDTSLMASSSQHRDTLLAPPPEAATPRDTGPATEQNIDNIMENLNYGTLRRIASNANSHAYRKKRNIDTKKIATDFRTLSQQHYCSTSNRKLYKKNDATEVYNRLKHYYDHSNLDDTHKRWFQEAGFDYAQYSTW